MSMIVQWDAVSATEFERLRDLDEDAFIDWLESAGERQSFDVDKAWHAVHFVLTGSAWDTSGPLGEIVLGGAEFGHDLGYGPPRWLTPGQVAECSAALAELFDDEIRARIDLAAMSSLDVYPSIWDRDPVEERLVEFVVDGVARIRAGFAAAADAGSGFVVSMG